MKRYTILLFLLLILTACGNEPISQIITHEIKADSVATAPALARTDEPADKLWLITDAVEHREQLHGKIISVVGYVGLQNMRSGRWIIDLWNEPLRTFEDMYRTSRLKNPTNILETWGDTGKGEAYWTYG